MKVTASPLANAESAKAEFSVMIDLNDLIEKSASFELFQDFLTIKHHEIWLSTIPLENAGLRLRTSITY